MAQQQQQMMAQQQSFQQQSMSSSQQQSASFQQGIVFNFFYKCTKMLIYPMGHEGRGMDRSEGGGTRAMLLTTVNEQQTTKGLFPSR